MSTHLWEIDHPYYCSTTNFRAKPHPDNCNHVTYDSWAEFTEDGWGHPGSDPDLNLVFRWDWYPADEDGPAKLQIFYMLQRKGDFWSISVTVTEDDEPAVREWLRAKAERIALIWEPFLAVVPASEEGQ